MIKKRYALHDRNYVLLYINLYDRYKIEKWIHLFLNYIYLN